MVQPNIVLIGNGDHSNLVTRMSSHHLPSVLELERYTQDAWDQDDFSRCLWNPICGGLVVQDSGKVVGYSTFEYTSSALRVFKILVDSEHRRQGLGTQIINYYKSQLTEIWCRLKMDVRESNLDAQLFLKQNGFQAIQIIDGAYPDTPESAYSFEYIFGRSISPAVLNRVRRYLSR